MIVTANNESEPICFNSFVQATRRNKMVSYIFILSIVCFLFHLDYLKDEWIEIMVHKTITESFFYFT